MEAKAGEPKAMDSKAGESSVGDAAGFFTRLRDWPATQAVLAHFDRVVAVRPLPAPEAFFETLYTQTLDALLALGGLPASAGAAHWEWRPLYRLARDLDPGYFSEQQIGERVAACDPPAGAPREALTRALIDFFALRQSGFPASYPSPLLSAADTRRWCGLFGEAHLSTALAVLPRAGLYPLGTPAAWRSYGRFREGAFEAPVSVTALHDWQQACERAAATLPAMDGTRVSAHQWDFLAATFGGAQAGPAAGGPCGSIPACAGCALEDGCRWAGTAPAQLSDGGSVVARLAHEAPGVLGDGQLLSAVLMHGPEVTRQLQERLDGLTLRSLGQWSREELMGRLAVDGLTADRLRALFELCRRFSADRLEPGMTIKTPEEVYRHFGIRLRELKQEQFLVVSLDLYRRYLGESMVTQGLLDRSLVHAREVFQAAIRNHAAAVMLVHNHPSGDPTPSPGDVDVTRRLVEAGRIVGIAVVDHVIIAEGGYTSLAEQGLMPP